MVGVGRFLEGFLRLDCQGIDVACDNDSWHSSAHRVESGIAAAATFLASFAAAVSAGVKIAMGTDSGVTPHGRNLRELELMVEGGMTPMQAIVAATVNAADLLGLGTEIGTIEPGKLADLVVHAPGGGLAEPGSLIVRAWPAITLALAILQATGIVALARTLAIALRRHVEQARSSPRSPAGTPFRPTLR